jgi:hypothetical protein
MSATKNVLHAEQSMTRLAYPTVPYRTVPYRTVPYRTVPYPTLLTSFTSMAYP